MNIERLELPKGLDRAEIRRYVVECFLDEKPGTADNPEKYKYIVEECENRNIMILRQTWLNKGMDFKVNFEDLYFPGKRRTRNPSHQHIFSDLEEKRNYDEVEYKKLTDCLTKVYDCEDDELLVQQLRSIDLPVGLLTPEEVCMTLKWLFIEQDITYWGNSGRHMLYQGLKDKNLV